MGQGWVVGMKRGLSCGELWVFINQNIKQKNYPMGKNRSVGQDRTGTGDNKGTFNNEGLQHTRRITGANEEGNEGDKWCKWNHNQVTRWGGQDDWDESTWHTRELRQKAMCSHETKHKHMTSKNNFF